MTVKCDSGSDSGPEASSPSTASSAICTISSASPIYQGGNSKEWFHFATLRYDPILLNSPENTAASFNRPCPFYLLEHQWTRLKVANWCTSFYRKNDSQQSNGYSNPSTFLRSLLLTVRRWQQTHPNELGAECLRIYVRTYISGCVTTEVKPVPRIPLDALFKTTFGIPSQLPRTTEWTVTLDTQATSISESTMYKTSSRYPYYRARAHAGILNPTAKKEVLLYNPEGKILDGSSSTPYFYRDGKWVTARSSCGGLQGTSRRWALENGLALEGVVSKDSLAVGEVVWFSGGSGGFFYARFVAPEEGLAQPTAEMLRMVGVGMWDK
ncbi:Aminodeoxychorismate lyase [Vermiconidia calcicola]|uniref:Aminodeoxychorismate lyase n=1 Tax=Vermiconidia calcicola TaxID=1690605 RepID=A0ACC3NCP2_9PEZI|nr:Aminodeoxychorismate lyase [Vermiconidia calcicola]